MYGELGAVRIWLGPGRFENYKEMVEALLIDGLTWELVVVEVFEAEAHEGWSY